MFLGRIGLQSLLERYLAPGDEPVALPAAQVIGELAANLCVAWRASRSTAWLSGRRVSTRGCWVWRRMKRRCSTTTASAARLMRCLTFDADRGSLLVELMLGVISEFRVDTSQLHNDSTSISLHGEYTAADGRQSAGKPTVTAAVGHSKDHRPELKQFVLTLTVSADGAVPLAHRLLDGNITDDQTHIETWDGLVALVGRSDFLYVADCKLATREQMAHIHSRRARFLSIQPRSRAGNSQIRQWAQTHAFNWTEARPSHFLCTHCG